MTSEGLLHTFSFFFFFYIEWQQIGTGRMYVYVFRVMWSFFISHSRVGCLGDASWKHIPPLSVATYLNTERIFGSFQNLYDKHCTYTEDSLGKLHSPWKSCCIRDNKLHRPRSLTVTMNYRIAFCTSAFIYFTAFYFYRYLKIIRTHSIYTLKWRNTITSRIEGPYHLFWIVRLLIERMHASCQIEEYHSMIHIRCTHWKYT